MTKAQLEAICRQFLNAAPDIIVAARQHSLNRSCMICNAAQGEQHTQDCALWELVAGRIDFPRLSENPTRSSTAVPNPIKVMTSMEAGTDLFAPAPTLLYADGGQR